MGIVGTGFIATNLANLLEGMPDFQPCKVLTHRPLESISHINPRLLTRDV